MHTQGQWEKANDGYIIAHKEINGIDSTLLICDCFMGEDDIPQSEAESNAHLIAAAPELLMACKTAINYLNHPDVQAMQFALPVSSVANYMQEIINKAECRDA